MEQVQAAEAARNALASGADGAAKAHKPETHVSHKRAATMAAQSATREDLEALFHLSLTDAAAQIGVRASCFLGVFPARAWC